MSTPTISAADVKALRDRTGAGMMDCKAALTEAEGNFEKAIEILRVKGQAAAAKRGERVASEGAVQSYIHHNNRIGALVEIDCETDFVARTEDFLALARDLALHIAATNPRYITTDEVPAAEIEASGRPAEDYYEEHVLLAQRFVKDGSQTIEDKIKATVAKVRENIIVRRFARYEVGG